VTKTNLEPTNELKIALLMYLKQKLLRGSTRKSEQLIIIKKSEVCAQ
jgi:hypothetical protein